MKYIKTFETISKEESLRALEIIKDYINQQPKQKTTISNWLKTLKTQPNGKLRNVLLKNFEYIDDVNQYNFFRCDNVNKKSWIELQNLLDQSNL